jgi:prepilin-type processing-associated H-X9-DG protein
MKTRKGFTLIQTLAVLAIIAFLAAIIFPSFNQAKQRAREVTCLNNLKQIFHATEMYAADNDDCITPYYTVSNHVGPDGAVRSVGRAHDLVAALLPYTHSAQVFLCPDWQAKYGGVAQPPLADSEGKRSPTTDPWWRVMTYQVDWGLAKYRNAEGNLDVPRLRAMTNPADTPYMGDVFYLIGDNNDSDQDVQTPADGYYSVHGTNRYNVLFFDGHAGMKHIAQGFTPDKPSQ